IAVPPAQAAGTVDIRVQSGTTRTNIDGINVFFGYGTSPIVAADQFTFGSSTTNPPTANPDSYSILHDKTLNVAAAGVLANDTSNPPGHTLTAALVTAPPPESSTLNANVSFASTPKAGSTGSAPFPYTAADGALVTPPATVSLSVPNQAPTAANNSYTTGKDTPLSISAPGVLGNDSDPDGDALTAVLANGPANGTLTLNADGSFTYTPNAGV